MTNSWEKLPHIVLSPNYLTIGHKCNIYCNTLLNVLSMYRESLVESADKNNRKHSISTTFLFWLTLSGFTSHFDNHTL